MDKDLKKVTVESPLELREIQLKEAYVDETAKNYDYSNFVRVVASQWGLLFSFGKMHPHTQSILVSREILVPFEVADSMAQIISKQLDDLQAKGLIEQRDLAKSKGTKK